MAKMGRPKAAEVYVQTGIRLPADLLARVDAYAEQLKALVPWANPTRADAIRALLGQALADHEGKKPRGAK
ncbi:MAG: ribbon-helix-helix domain-containing protein [Vicinamibacteria bacterium]|nr:ribbon-helix-helix domain-containing protein [Vicinamibacteria bacterium]